MKHDFLTIGPRIETELAEPSRRARLRANKSNSRVKHSANLVVDLGGTCQAMTTIAVGGGGLGVMSGQIGVVSGLAMLASGGIVGQSVDMLHSDTFCNLMVAGQLINTSGQLRIAVQTSDTDVSGNYTDPTSGLAQFPTYFQSGGILWLNSGGQGSGVLNVGASGYALQSGFIQFAAFQRPQRFARAVALSGDFYVGPLSVGFVSQLKTTSSGGGFSYSPGSGVVSV